MNSELPKNSGKSFLIIDIPVSYEKFRKSSDTKYFWLHQIFVLFPEKTNIIQSKQLRALRASVVPLSKFLNIILNSCISVIFSLLYLPILMLTGWSKTLLTLMLLQGATTIEVQFVIWSLGLRPSAKEHTCRHLSHQLNSFSDSYKPPSQGYQTIAPVIYFFQSTFTFPFRRQNCRLPKTQN